MQRKRTKQRRKWSPTANDPQTGNDPEPQMIPDVDLKWSRWKTSNGMEIVPRAASASAVSAFWKTHKWKLISNWTRKTVWLLINNTNMKKFALKKSRKMFLEAIFSHSRKLFSEFSYKIFVIALHEIIGQQNFSVFLQIIFQNYDDMCNLHWCYTLCTGVTLELHCSQPIRIE